MNQLDLVNSLIAAPLAHAQLSKSPEAKNHAVDLSKYAIVFKTGHPEKDSLHAINLEGNNLVATRDPWMYELNALVVGTRVLIHQPDRKDPSGYRDRSGGIVKAVVVIAEPTFGRAKNSAGKLEEAVYVPVLEVSEAKGGKPLRFSEINTWNCGEIVSYPRVVLTPCPIRIWEEFVLTQEPK
jgi:hypothetical protein